MFVSTMCQDPFYRFPIQYWETPPSANRPVLVSLVRSILLNVEPVTHWFWRIQKKILAPKHLVLSNFINYIWSLNTNRTCPYFLSTFLLFLNSTGVFARWLGCRSWLRHQNKNTILLWCICKRCFARPQAVQVWNQMGSSQMYTQRAFLPVFPGLLTLERPGWKRGSVPPFLLKKELKKKYFASPVLLEELHPSFSSSQRPVRGLVLLNSPFFTKTFQRHFLGHGQ